MGPTRLFLACVVAAIGSHYLPLGMDAAHAVSAMP
jgi:hypothetical protein